MLAGSLLSEQEVTHCSVKVQVMQTTGEEDLVDGSF